jgi:hypothetical protein
MLQLRSKAINPLAGNRPHPWHENALRVRNAVKFLLPGRGPPWRGRAKKRRGQRRTPASQAFEPKIVADVSVSHRQDKRCYRKRYSKQAWFTSVFCPNCRFLLVTNLTCHYAVLNHSLARSVSRRRRQVCTHTGADELGEDQAVGRSDFFDRRRAR